MFLNEYLSVHTTRLPCPIVFLLILFVFVIQINQAQAGYGIQSPSDTDPAIVAISEDVYLGAVVEKNIFLEDINGKTFSLREILDKPVLLVFSYFGCDGACPTVNKTLKRTLAQVDGWKLGKDYYALTLSFNKNDNTKTLNKFLHEQGWKDKIPVGWKIATFQNPEDIVPFTRSLGFKFFWDPRDRVFLHPSVYFMLSPEGRITRMLYPNTINADDVELAITKAYGNEITLSPKNMINLFIGTCFSYNYKDGKYTLNYPMFIAWGALIFGFLLLIGGSITMIRRVKI